MLVAPRARGGTRGTRRRGAGVGFASTPRRLETSKKPAEHLARAGPEARLSARRTRPISGRASHRKRAVRGTRPAGLEGPEPRARLCRGRAPLRRARVPRNSSRPRRIFVLGTERRSGHFNALSPRRPNAHSSAPRAPSPWAPRRYSGRRRVSASPAVGPYPPAPPPAPRAAPGLSIYNINAHIYNENKRAYLRFSKIPTRTSTTSMRSCALRASRLSAHSRTRLLSFV